MRTVTDGGALSVVSRRLGSWILLGDCPNRSEGAIRPTWVQSASPLRYADSSDEYPLCANAIAGGRSVRPVHSEAVRFPDVSTKAMVGATGIEPVTPTMST